MRERREIGGELAVLVHVILGRCGCGGGGLRTGYALAAPAGERTAHLDVLRDARLTDCAHANARRRKGPAARNCSGICGGRSSGTGSGSEAGGMVGSAAGVVRGPACVPAWDKVLL